MTKISSSDVRKVAQLARLELPEDQIETYTKQLEEILSYVDQLQEIVDAVGDKIDVICEGGFQRGTHMLKALSMGAKACAGGRLYLYALAEAGQEGVERALNLYKTELVRDMKLMGCTKISDLNRNNLSFRNA